MLRRHFLSAPLLLAQSRSTPYTICLSREASPAERHAALELQTHLEQMCSARLPVASEDDRPQGPLILLGRQSNLDKLGFEIPFEKLGREGFALKTKGEHIAIAGGRQRGTMYGAYDFLERLGCRWYANDLTVVPKRAALQVPALDVIERPGFEYRDILIKEACTKDFAVRNRINGHFAELDSTTGGHVLFEPFVHSFYALVPPAKYFGSHPEYYALVNGERRQEREHHHRAAVCGIDDRSVEPAIQLFFDNPVCAFAGLAERAAASVIEGIGRVHDVGVHPAQGGPDGVGIAAVKAVRADGDQLGHSVSPLARRRVASIRSESGNM